MLFIFFSYIYIYIYIYIYVYIYINLLAKYYPENKERLQKKKKACKRYKISLKQKKK